MKGKLFVTTEVIKEKLKKEMENDDARPSTLTTDENIEEMRKVISDNRRITIREVC